MADNYNIYVTLVHKFIHLACVLFTIYASLVLMIKKSKKFTPTPVIYLYFIYTASCSVLSLINVVYSLVLWRPNEVIYHPLTLYYISGIPIIYVNFAPMADFWLSFDRLLVVAYPHYYDKKWKRVNGGVFVLANVLLFSAYFLATNFFAYSPKESTTTCSYYFCLVLKLNYPQIIIYVHYTMCGLSFAVAVMLIGFLNARSKLVNSSNKAANKFNKPILIIIFITLVCVLAPKVITTVFTSATGASLTTYLGEYSSSLSYVNIAVCVYLYYRTFKKHMVNQHSTVQVINISSRVSHK